MKSSRLCRSIASAGWKVLPYVGILLVALWVRSELVLIRSELDGLKERAVTDLPRGTNEVAKAPPVQPPQEASLGSEPPVANKTFRLEPIDAGELRRLEESASIQTAETYGQFFGGLEGYALEDVEALKAILNEQQVQSSLVGREMIGLPREEAKAVALKLVEIEREKKERLRATLSPEDYERFEVYDWGRSYKPKVDAMLNRMQSRLVPVADGTRRDVLDAYTRAVLESSRSSNPDDTPAKVEERFLYNVIKEVSTVLDGEQLDAFTGELSKDL